jgi:hypothetical protein
VTTIQHHNFEVAHPTGFEPVTSAFGARCLSAKYLKILARNPTNQRERIGNTTALSGNNPEEQIIDHALNLVTAQLTF